MSVQVWFAQEEVNVTPGASISLSLAVENVGDHTETYTIIPAGLTAAWTTVTRPNVTLFAGSRDVVEVVVRPPQIYSTSAGPTSIAARVIPQNEPDDTAVAETIVAVDAFDDRRITVLQPVQRGRRRATYELMVENHGNNLATCRLHLVDASNRVDGSFDPPAVGVAPGSNSLVRLRLRARRSFFRRTERQLDFEIEATEPDRDPAAGRASLIQPPTVPVRSAAKALAFAGAIAAIPIAWFAVVKPELRDAADDAVADRVGALELSAPASTVAPSATITPIADEPVAAVQTEGEPVSYRIAVNVGVTQEDNEVVVVPPDRQFLMTDLVLQNVNGDLGTAQLLRNGDVLYRWDLGTMNGANDFQPRVTPLPFAPGDNIVLTVACDNTGAESGTGCEIAALLGGRLVPPPGA